MPDASSGGYVRSNISVYLFISYPVSMGKTGTAFSVFSFQRSRSFFFFFAPAAAARTGERRYLWHEQVLEQKSTPPTHSTKSLTKVREGEKKERKRRGLFPRRLRSLALLIGVYRTPSRRARDNGGEDRRGKGREGRRGAAEYILMQRDIRCRWKNNKLTSTTHEGS
ncbi:hypothetical protein F5Y14DRAFT_288370 [Nemania sp. NC0429]|nr:hypothetical protein F5Y14DRAFT_288370 [Nemania sp. NC0429]